MALYTITLDDFLDSYESSDEWQAIVTRFNTLPNFTINGLNLNVYTMFKRKFLMREIGSETAQKFVRYINMQLDVALIEYTPKITAFINNYSDLFNKVITSTKTGTEDIDNTQAHTGTIEDVANNDDKQYFNPSSSDSDKIKDRNVIDGTNTRTFGDTNTMDNTKTYNLTYENELAISNADFLKGIQDVKSYYNEFVNSFEICFMGIY